MLIHVVLVGLSLLSLLVGLLSWFVSSSLCVRETSPQRMQRVLSVSAETITLPRRRLTASDGTFAIIWQDGEALLGEIVEGSARTVTRRIVKASTLPPVGSQVRWNKFVYQGDPQSALGLAYEEVSIPCPLGELPAWLIPGEQSTWILLIHGRGATREEALRVLSTLAEVGMPQLVMTYRNDAGAPKSPDQRYHLGDTEWEDVEAGVRYAISHGARDVALFGWSMGGCLVETFLHRSPYAKQVRAVVLDSPILNVRRVLDAQVRRQHLPHWATHVIAWLAHLQTGIDFAALNYEPPRHDLAIPTLLFHGTADTQVPVVSSDLFAQARPASVSYLRMQGIDHTLVWNADPQAYDRALKMFFQQIEENAIGHR